MYFAGEKQILCDLFEKERALRKVQCPFDGRYGIFPVFDQPMFTSS